MDKKLDKQIKDVSFKCPSCKSGTITLHKTTYDISDGDKMLIIKFECDKCDFTQNDVIPLTTRFDPGIMTLRVENEKDLKSKIYRSPTGRLEIPELELVVDPGPNADFYFTNVEGVLFRFEDAVNIYKNNMDATDPQKDEIIDILAEIKRALKGELNFTLKITDPGGGSYIIPQDNSKFFFEHYNPQ